MIQIDIARMLAHSAGLQLSKAQTASREKNQLKESEACIHAILLFQAAIEAIINEELFTHPLLAAIRNEELELHKRFKSLSFKNKWKKAYEALQIKDTEYLEAYLRFYSTYRVPITHPKSRYVSVQKYSCKSAYHGIENGWYMFQLLYAILGKELTSWDDFCNEIDLDLSEPVMPPLTNQD